MNKVGLAITCFNSTISLHHNIKSIIGTGEGSIDQNFNWKSSLLEAVVPLSSSYNSNLFVAVWTSGLITYRYTVWTIPPLQRPAQNIILPVNLYMNKGNV